MKWKIKIIVKINETKRFFKKYRSRLLDSQNAAQISDYLIFLNKDKATALVL